MALNYFSESRIDFSGNKIDQNGIKEIGPKQAKNCIFSLYKATSGCLRVMNIFIFFKWYLLSFLEHRMMSSGH